MTKTHCVICERLLVVLWSRLRDREVINHRRRIPVGVQVIVRSLERSRSRPELLKVRNQVLRVGSQFGFEFGNGDVSDLQLLPGLFIIRLEYLVERLNFRVFLSLVRLSIATELDGFTLLSPEMLKARFFSCSAGRCVKT
jgi:hypothetical protein